ncbi:hypothetical protein SBA3_830016 [Candidatus Sulfopaludibacter sp. SbA3]|nr:hypothetical protein SBA3_830016 [Candidatus Sulfopaludibacter sp. SbA3]
MLCERHSEASRPWSRLTESCPRVSQKNGHAVTTAPRYRVEPLRADHDRVGFHSGAEELDRYLHQQASQDARRKVAFCVSRQRRGERRLLHPLGL